tara:strand:+ start:432 stop:833 length:402 start_codon:yes stop_codon:yes gene_type:complete
MNNKIYFKIFPIFFILFLFSKNVCAQGSTEDQYKQMGGISGLSEVCFKSKNLELALFKQIGQLFYTQPEMGEVIFGLLYTYFDAKSVAMQNKVIWNGTTQSYNKKKFDCNNASDTKLIKQFEMQLMNGLKSQG